MNSAAKTAYIGYGFMEGSLHGRRMRRALRQRGYTVTASPNDAAVVILHSGAYLICPEPKPTQQFLLIDPSTSNTQRVLTKILRHALYDIRHVLLSSQWRFWCSKTLYNWCYFATHFKSALAMYRKLPESIPRLEHLVSLPHITVTRSADTSWHYVVDLDDSNTHIFNDSHDDCWLHPDRYLDLLDKS